MAVITAMMMMVWEENQSSASPRSSNELQAAHPRHEQAQPDEIHRRASHPVVVFLVVLFHLVIGHIHGGHEGRQ